MVSVAQVKMLRTNVVAAYGPVAPRPLVLPAARVGAERQLLLGTASRVRQTFHLAILPSAPNQFVVAGDQVSNLSPIRVMAALLFAIVLVLVAERV